MHFHNLVNKQFLHSLVHPVHLFAGVFKQIGSTQEFSERITNSTIEKVFLIVQS